jgi:undecaprenyl diphosphate synthase
MSKQTENNIPKHVGIILDGNRRWAKDRRLPPMKGHEQGVETLKSVAKHGFEKGIKYLSVFVFSTENWNRSKDEVKFLMNLILKLFEKELDQFVKDGYKIVVLGSRDNVSNKICKAIDTTEQKTKDNTKGTLAICFNYSAKQELADASAKIATDVKKGIQPKDFHEYLYHPEVPDIDLLIRTSGEQRLSGFMLPRANYAELVFNDIYWPSYTSNDLDIALDEYSSRNRRFGN